MAFIKKEWKNRLVEFAGRRKLTRVAGSIDNQIIVDVTREEGAVSQQGDAFSGENMNDLEQRIEDGFGGTVDKDNILDKEGVEANTEAGKYVADALVVKELNDSLKFPDGTKFYADIQDGKPGFNTDPERGADTFRPFNTLETVYFKSGTSSIDFTDIITSIGKDVSDFTVKNFKLVMNNISVSVGIGTPKTGGGAKSVNATSALSLSYSNGICKISSSASAGNSSFITTWTNSTPSAPANTESSFWSQSGTPTKMSAIGIIFDPSDTPFQ